MYDFIYIDGSHEAKDVLMDAVLAWGLLKVGGVMAFDDYEGDGYLEPEALPKIAIDGFLATHKQMYEMLHSGYQIHIRKIDDQLRSLTPRSSKPLKITRWQKIVDFMNKYWE